MPIQVHGEIINLVMIHGDDSVTWTPPTGGGESIEGMNAAHVGSKTGLHSDVNAYVWSVADALPVSSMSVADRAVIILDTPVRIASPMSVADTALAYKWNVADAKPASRVSVADTCECFIETNP